MPKASKRRPFPSPPPLSAVHRQASSQRVVPQAAWDGFDRGARDPAAPGPQQDFASWLPDFFYVLLAATNSELRCSAAVLPDLHPNLVLHLLATLFTKITKSFKSRLMSACAQGGICWDLLG